MVGGKEVLGVMTNDSEPQSPRSLFIQLLDSAQGRPIQAWRFDNLPSITIGRAEDNHIAIADQQVSRLHAKLVWQENGWQLISLGRNGTVIDNHLVSEFQLTDQTIFRLGTDGPMLRVRLTEAEPTRTETISNFDPSMIAMLAVDEARTQEEVRHITEDALFQGLLEQSQIMKARRRESPS
jgi:pSer/pThr/pTyr-binding forkhead associated (FHA) protein